MRQITNRMDSIYHIDTDIECKVLHYGKEVCFATPGDDVCIELRKGRHKLTFVSTENVSDQYSIMYEVPENDIEDCIDVRLTPYRDNRLQKEAEERRIAYEAEQKRIREAKEREAQELKRKQEAERKRREEVEQQKAIAEEERQRVEAEKRLREEREKRYDRFFKIRDEYKDFAITSIPTLDDNTSYLSCVRFSELRGYTPHQSGFEPFIAVYEKKIGDHSEIIPVIRLKKTTVQFKEKELIKKFADISYHSIKEFCCQKEEGIFLSKHLLTRSTIIRPLTLGNKSKVVEEQRVKSQEELKVEEEHRREQLITEDIQRRNRIISTNLSIDHTPAVFCGFIYSLGQQLKRDSFLTKQDYEDFKDNRFRYKRKIDPKVEFFLYLAATKQQWRDFYYELLDKPFPYYEPGYREKVLKLLESQEDNPIFKYEYDECRLIYIDEAYNEIVDATGYDAISTVNNGIMVWAKRKSSSLFDYSIRDYKGNELFSFEYEEPTFTEPAKQYKLFTHSGTKIPLVFYCPKVKDDGSITFSGGVNELWMSGVLNTVPNITERQIINNKDDIIFVNSNPQLNGFPLKPLCCKIDGRYFLSTYKGFLEIEKPRNWDR